MATAGEIVGRREGVRLRQVRRDFDVPLEEEIDGLLEEAQALVVAFLVEASSRDYPSTQSARSVWLAGVLRQVRRLLREKYDEIASAITGSMERVVPAESAFVGETLSRAAAPAVEAGVVSGIRQITPSQALVGRLSRRGLVAIDGGAATVGDWLRGQQERVLQAIGEVLLAGVTRGDSMPQIVRQLTGTRRQPGPIGASRRWARVVAQTSLTHSMQGMRDELYQNNRDVVQGVQWISARDERTTLICWARESQLWKITDQGYEPVDHDIPFNGGPPAHANCRSVTAPWLFSAQEMGLPSSNRTKAARTARSQLDGRPPRRETNLTAFRRLAERARRKVLGVTRLRYLESGAVPKLTDFLDRDGNVISVERLLESIRER